MCLRHDFSDHSIFCGRPPLLEVFRTVFEKIRNLRYDRPAVRPVVAGIGSYVVLLHLIVEQQLVAFIGICRNVQQVTCDFGVFDKRRVESAYFSMEPFSGAYVSVILLHETRDGILADDIHRQEFLFHFFAGGQRYCRDCDQYIFEYVFHLPQSLEVERNLGGKAATESIGVFERLVAIPVPALAGSP